MRLFRWGRCRRCGRERVTTMVERIEGVDGNVSVAIGNVPVLRCPDGHDTRPHLSEPSARSFRALMREMRPDHGSVDCPAGDVDVEGEPIGMHRWELVVPNETGPIGVEVEAPGRRCPVCQVIAADSGEFVLELKLPKATKAAFKSVGAW